MVLHNLCYYFGMGLNCPDYLWFVICSFSLADLFLYEAPRNLVYQRGDRCFLWNVKAFMAYYLTNLRCCNDCLWFGTSFAYYQTITAMIFYSIYKYELLTHWISIRGWCRQQWYNWLWRIHCCKFSFEQNGVWRAFICYIFVLWQGWKWLYYSWLNPASMFRA